MLAWVSTGCPTSISIGRVPQTVGDGLLSTLCLFPSSSVEALKTLMRSTGYGDYVSYIQKLGGWELLTSPERHYEGVTLLAR